MTPKNKVTKAKTKARAKVKTAKARIKEAVPYPVFVFDSVSAANEPVYEEEKSRQLRIQALATIALATSLLERAVQHFTDRAEWPDTKWWADYKDYRDGN